MERSRTIQDDHPPQTRRTHHGKADVEVGADSKSCRSTLTVEERRQGCHRVTGIRGLQGIEEEWRFLIARLCKICRYQKARHERASWHQSVHKRANCVQG